MRPLGTILLAVSTALLPDAVSRAGPPASLSEALARVDSAALERVIRSRGGPEEAHRMERLASLTKALESTREGVASGRAESVRHTQALLAFKRQVLLENPILTSFDEILLVRRRGNRGDLGLPANWQGNSSLRRTGWDNQILAFSMRNPDHPPRTVYRPEGGGFVGDLRLHFDAKRMLFSMPGSHGRWQVFEMILAEGIPRELPLILESDVDNYDACYLPDGNILFSSTAPFIGVPCVGGKSHVTNLYLLERTTGRIRRLTFDQEHNWHPAVMNNGRVMYTRWEYSDLPHFASRLVFQMNPDGTNQGELYGSNSYWPNSVFYARPIPGHPTMFAGIVSGHHGVRRMGELVLFDPARGRHEADGVVQRVPGYGKPVKPIILDALVDKSWPKFLHPCPLGSSFGYQVFLVSCKPTPTSNWGIYLVDTFDNLLLLKEEPHAVLFEPVAVRRRPIPPVIPGRVSEGETRATMFISDIYNGPGLTGVPRGTVKNLRLFTYQFAYQGMGGQPDRVGTDGPWDIKRVLGTVPVAPDGSALFHVPANTPISLQPLDRNGRALARMRSWTTAMPGEVQSCAGCHERQNSTPPALTALPLKRAPDELTPWYGPERGFSFNREVQPVLDRHCVGCHHGAEGKPAPNLTLRPSIPYEAGNEKYRVNNLFPPAYQALRAYVRTGPMESDLHLLPPCEFHASTTELVQLLESGHHGVRLDTESWGRLNTWIDRAPAHGTWRIVGERRVSRQRERRLAMLQEYAGVAVDAEAIPEATPTRIEPVVLQADPRTVPPPPSVDGWPFGRDEALRRQQEVSPPARTVDLGDGIHLALTGIPAGTYVMGDGRDRPRQTVHIDRPFWIGRYEITNDQFARFDATHDSRLEHGDFLHFGSDRRGTPLNGPKQPVTRVSWEHARQFCRWLSSETGLRFNLPTEAQWEYACRAGTATPFWFGSGDTSFQNHANLADKAFQTHRTVTPPWRLAVVAVNDGFRASSPVGRFAPNPWSLCDMHGNVWEWTRDAYAGEEDERRAARGGSWGDRPHRATATARVGYPPWQMVYNVGFRVICEQ